MVAGLAREINFQHRVSNWQENFMVGSKVVSVMNKIGNFQFKKSQHKNSEEKVCESREFLFSVRLHWFT